MEMAEKRWKDSGESCENREKERQVRGERGRSRLEQ